MTQSEPRRSSRKDFNELHSEPQYALDQVSCLLHGSVVARNTGEVHPRNRTRAGSAADIAADTIKTARKLRVFMDLAEAYREADQLPEAIDAFEQASVRLTALGRDETETAGTLFNNWALALQQIGRPIDAEKPIYRRAIDISRADRSEQGVSPMLLNNYAFNP